MPELLDLPLEILTLAASYLETTDLLHFCATCQALRQTFTARHLRYLVEHSHSIDPAAEQVARDSSFLIICHAFSLAIWRHFRAKNFRDKSLPLLLRKKATLAAIPHDKLVRRTFMTYGSRRQLDFLFRHGASNSSLGDVNELLEEYLLERRNRALPEPLFGKAYDYLKAHGASLYHLPSGPDRILGLLLENRRNARALIPLLDVCALLDLVPPQLIDHLKSQYEQHFLNADTTWLFDYIPNALNILLKYALLKHGIGNHVMRLLQRGASFEQLIRDENPCRQTALVKLLPGTGPGIEFEDMSDYPAIYYAASSGTLEFARLLLERGADCNAGSKSGWTPLHISASHEDIDMILLLLQHGANPSPADRDRKTPLHLAVSSSSSKCAEILIEKGADVNLFDDDGWTPLTHALEFGNEHMVRILLDREADVEASDLSRNSELHLVTQRGSVEMAKLLIEYGADVNRPNRDLLTPLHSAVCNGDLALMRLFLSNSANVNTLNIDDCSPIYSAAEKGQVEAVRLLLEKDADPFLGKNIPLMLVRNAHRTGDTEKAKTLLDLVIADHATMDLNVRATVAMRTSAGNSKLAQDSVDLGADHSRTTSRDETPLTLAASHGLLGIVQCLVQKGAGLEVVQSRGMTALLLAAEKGHADCVAVLLAAGADVEHRDDQRISALMLAIMGGYDDVVRLLLQRGASVSRTSDNKWTPLQTAAKYGHVKVLRTLIGHGADIMESDGCGERALDLAAGEGHEDVVLALLKRGAAHTAAKGMGPSPLHLAAAAGHCSTVRVLVAHGADKEARGTDGLTPLSAAAYHNRLDVVRCLIDAGADVTAANDTGRNALWLAAHHPSIELVQLLFRQGCPYRATTEGYTPMFAAAKEGHVEVMRYFRNQGEHLDATAKGKRTPLDVAAAYGRFAVVKWLLEEQHVRLRPTADVELPALYVAVRCGYLPIVRLLLRHGADVNARTAVGFRPLDAVSFTGNNGLALVLHQHGAKPSTLPGRVGHITRNFASALLGVGVQLGKDLLGLPTGLGANTRRDELLEIAAARRANRDAKLAVKRAEKGRKRAAEELAKRQRRDAKAMANQYKNALKETAKQQKGIAKQQKETAKQKKQTSKQQKDAAKLVEKAPLSKWATAGPSASETSLV